MLYSRRSVSVRGRSRFEVGGGVFAFQSSPRNSLFNRGALLEAWVSERGCGPRTVGGGRDGNHIADDDGMGCNGWWWWCIMVWRWRKGEREIDFWYLSRSYRQPTRDSKRDIEEEFDNLSRSYRQPRVTITVPLILCFSCNLVPAIVNFHVSPKLKFACSN